MRNKSLYAVIFTEVIVLALIYLREAGSLGFPLDDSWIYAHFARNIAEGRGFVYNLHQPMLPTGPLYALILGGARLLIPNPVIGAAIIGIGFHLGAAILVHSTAREFGFDKRVCAACAMAFTAIPRLIWGALSGMEVSLYVFLVTLGLYWHIRFANHCGYRVFLSALAFGLAALTRPECGAFLLVSITSRWIGFNRIKGVQFAWYAVGQVITFTAIVSPMVVLNLVYTGYPLPSAFYAKVGMSSAALNPLSAVLSYLCQAIRISYLDNAPLLLLAGIGSILSINRTNRRGMVLLLAFFIVPIITGLFSHTGSGRMQLLFQTGRYSAYLVPVIILLAGFGNTVIIKRFEGSRWPVVVILAAVLSILCIGNIRMARAFGAQVSEINAMQVSIGKWARNLPQRTAIAANDVGAVAYYSRKTIIDTVGVVNIEVIPYLKHYPDRSEGLLQYLEKRKPDYLVIYPDWYSSLSRRKDIIKPIKSVQVEQNIVSGGKKMVIYRYLGRYPQPE